MDYGEKLISSTDRLPVTVSDALLHLGYHDDEGAEILDQLQDVLEEAVDYVEGQTRRELVERTWEHYLPGFPSGCIELPRAPLLGVESVEYFDASGARELLPSVEYEIDATRQRGLIAPAVGKSWPSTYGGMTGVIIRYRAGYATESTVPPKARAFVKLKTEDLWRFRGTTELGRRPMLVPQVEERFRTALKIPVL